MLNFLLCPIKNYPKHFPFVLVHRYVHCFAKPIKCCAFTLPHPIITPTPMSQFRRSRETSKAPARAAAQSGRLTASLVGHYFALSDAKGQIVEVWFMNPSGDKLVCSHILFAYFYVSSWFVRFLSLFVFWQIVPKSPRHSHHTCAPRTVVRLVPG